MTYSHPTSHVSAPVSQSHNHHRARGGAYDPEASGTDQLNVRGYAVMSLLNVYWEGKYKVSPKPRAFTSFNPWRGQEFKPIHNSALICPGGEMELLGMGAGSLAEMGS